jgi:hypothetical protein
MAYVYRHIRLDKNEPFYIGIGSDANYARANSHKGRNPYWLKIVEKTEYEVEILVNELNWVEALKKEKEFIQLYGRVDNKTGILCNLTDGGEGVLGKIVSYETKQKQSLVKKRPQTKQHREKAAKSHFKKIVQLNMDENIIKIWESLKEADSFGFKEGKIIACAKYRIRQYKGFLWKYLDNVNDCKKYVKPSRKVREIETYSRGIKRTEDAKLKNKLARSKGLSQYTLDGIYIRDWVCSYDACRELNFKSASKITDCCRNERNQYMGFKWKYIKNN